MMFVCSSTCKTALVHSHFDWLINDFYQDVKLEMCLAFDVIVEHGVLPSKALDIIIPSSFALMMTAKITSWRMRLLGWPPVRWQEGLGQGQWNVSI